MRIRPFASGRDWLPLAAACRRSMGEQIVAMSTFVTCDRDYA